MKTTSSSKVIVHIMGGLGNQMFQYAFGRMLSLRYDVPMKLDVLDFIGYELHNGFEIQHVFDLSVNIATESDFYQVMGWRGNRLVRKVARRLGYECLRSTTMLQQNMNLSAVDHIQIAAENCYLSGCWQSELYFQDEEKVIRKDFLFKPLMSVENKKWSELIRNPHSVCLHVRRGDYVSNPHTHSVHGVCGIEYYKNAINYLAERFEELTFFVFSDDIPWVRKNLSIPFTSYYINHNHGHESYNDMYLMTLCQHHIIANSSFSWWGAWLSNSAESGHNIVIAPKHWANSKTIALDEVCPNEWVRL